MTSTAEISASGVRKGTKKARVGAASGHVGAPKAKSARKAAEPKPKRSDRNTPSTHEDSKAGKILGLLKRPNGAAMSELMDATDWQPHSVRGFLSGNVRKKMGLEVLSGKGQDGVRRYSVKP